MSRGIPDNESKQKTHLFHLILYTLSKRRRHYLFPGLLSKRYINKIIGEESRLRKKQKMP